MHIDGEKLTMSNNNYPFIVWGSGGTAKKISDIIEANAGKIIAIFDRDPHVKSVLEGVPIYYGEKGLKDWLSHPCCESPCNALVGAGSASGSERIEILNLLSRYHFLTPSVVHPTAFISRSARMLRGCEVFTNAIVDAHSALGEACIINDGARVGHDCVVGNGVHIAPGGILLGRAVISDNVLIGANAVVMPGVKVGKNSIVGAGAVVLSDLPPNIVAVGNPAKISKTRI